MKDSEFFFYGVADIKQHGDEHKPLQYALYNPIIDCFVLTSSDLETLHLVSLLFSSRYNLILCRLDQADNFRNNLIDNSICMNWTLSRSNSLNFTRFPKFNKVAHIVTHLENDTNNNLLKLNFSKDLEYLWATVQWISRLNTIINESSQHIPFIEDFLKQFLQLPIETKESKLKQEIYSTIYYDFEFSSARSKIEKLLYAYAK